MKILVLGGTAWLGRELASQALARGDEVWCLARGQSGPAADGVRLVAADRQLGQDAYAPIADQSFDAVIEVSWQPQMVSDALRSLRQQAGHWTYVSSCSVYAEHKLPGADESTPLLPALTQQVATLELYGEAKVACEAATLNASGEQALIVRAGLIGGPGDVSDRAGYWVARAALLPDAPMLIPDSPDATAQVIDVRDLASWILACAAGNATGTFDAVGEALALDRWIALSRAAGGHHGPVVKAEPQWLLDHDVAEFMGPGSLPLWLADPDWRGFSARSGAHARARGLVNRPAAATITDTLVWEQTLGLDRERKAGLRPERERELIASLRS